MRNIFFFMLVLLSVSTFSFAQTSGAGWIWYPGDFEIWLSNEMQNRRTERNAFVPPFWRVYSHHPLVNFTKAVTLSDAEEIDVLAEGDYNVTIDSKYVQTGVSGIVIPPGKHTINVQVFNQKSPPAVFITGKTIQSDKSWAVSIIRNNYPDNLPSDSKPQYADAWEFMNANEPPSQFKLRTKEVKPVKTDLKENSIIVDFGRETFGFVRLKNVQGRGRLSFYYGESLEEALSIDSCETLDHFTLTQATPGDFINGHSRAFRYVHIRKDPAIYFEEADMLYEYLPVSHRGSFRCSDEALNRIWDVAEYTLELTTREFFVDGIKRDRWIWSGDANQSYLMNYYSFFDSPAVKRTIWALRGGEPVSAHINTIVDYSFYWFMSIYDYYLYTGDEALLRQVYPKMVTLMEFCLARRNAAGMVEGLPGDWVFLDWAPIEKDGELSAMQILFCRSLEAMALCASLVNDEERANEYKLLAEKLRGDILKIFWDEKQQAMVHNRKNGQTSTQVTRYANMFAMMFGYLDSAKIRSVMHNVMLNDDVLKITTPYMRFYELEALCVIGHQKFVTKEIKDYWGGMLKEGATAFWEKYDPNEKGAQRYEMYGRPYGKSLCHAWGASPVYLLGKYYLGVKPLKPGYETYIVQPDLGGLKWMEGRVPTPKGDISVSMSEKEIKISTVKGQGILKFRSSKTPKSSTGSIVKKGNNSYELKLDPEKEYTVTYSAIK